MNKLVATGLVLTAACMVGEDTRPHIDDNGVLDLSSALLVHSRDHLQVCVQIDPLLADQTATLIATLTDDLTRLSITHPDWSVSGLDHGAISVELGCPGGAQIDAPIDAKGVNGAVLGPGFTATPSPFRLHVYVIADARAASVLGDQPYARALAELVAVDQDRVAEVSTALVVPAALVGTIAFRNVLADGVGLAPR